MRWLDEWLDRRRSLPAASEAVRYAPSTREPSFTPDWGWRKRPIFAALGLRPPTSQHAREEGALLRRYAADRSTIVEIGVAEGASAWEMGQAMPADGMLFLIDPYPSRLGAARFTAKRLVDPTARGQVTWVREFSHEAVSAWERPIDLLFIDGDHSFEACRRDWEDWVPFVAEDGLIAMHDGSPRAPWTSPTDGPVRVAAAAEENGWTIIDEALSLVVLARR